MQLHEVSLGPVFRERLFRLASVLEALHSSPRAYAYIVAATLSSYVLSLGHPYLMPVLNTLAIYPLYLIGIRQRRLRTTLRYVVVWAVSMTAIVITFTVLWPELMKQSVLSGEAYKARMLQAIQASAGVEGTWQNFVAKYVREGALFLILAAVSIGFLALMMGAFLMNYMNYYVGYLFATAKNPAVVLFIGWPPWSIVRVVGFNMAALGISCLVLHRVFGKRSVWPEARPYLLLGMSFIVMNVLLRLALDPYWKVWLQPQL